MKRNKQLFLLLLWIVFVLSVSFLSGKITEANLAPWYSGLNKSSLTPPAFLFPLVWSFLYILIAVAGWLLWKKRNLPKVRLSLNFYLLQLAMNWLWTPLFFHFHLLVFSFFWLLSLCFFTLLTIITAWPEEKKAALLLMPYQLWLLFAAYLNGMIWILNAF